MKDIFDKVYFIEESESISEEIWDQLDNYKPPKESLTCYGCNKKDICKCAWDAYNTNGDCLMEK